MRKLIALAAAAGLAVSSWGLTVQDTAEANLAPVVAISVVPDAQVGAWVAPRLYDWGSRRFGMQRYIVYDTFGSLMEGSMASIAGTIGTLLGGTLGVPGALAGAAIGGGLGGF